MSDIDIAAAAEMLLEARRTRRWLAELPRRVRPITNADAYAIQDVVARQLGAVGGWKVGAATPDAEPFRGPVQASTIFKATDRIPADMLHLIGVEAEIAYRFSRNLPPRDTPYTSPEVMDAIGTMHPVIEIVDTRFMAFNTTDPLSHRADHQNGGALVVGPGIADWRGIDPLTQLVRLTLDGALRHEGIGGNSAGDNVRLLVWMANHGARSHGGLRAGQIVTTGSCSGTDFVAPGTRIHAEFPGIGLVDIDMV
jgi:2-keto-4-pentenoate hydratase